MTENADCLLKDLLEAIARLVLAYCELKKCRLGDALWDIYEKCKKDNG